MMMPTTLATMSRNESKLNGISRARRRRRIMAFAYLDQSRTLPAHCLCFFGIHILAGHRHLESFQNWIRQVIGTQTVRQDTEADHRTIRRFAGANRGLAARHHLLDRFEQGIALVFPSRDLGRGDALPGRKQHQALGRTFDGNDPVPVANQWSRTKGFCTSRSGFRAGQPESIERIASATPCRLLQIGAPLTEGGGDWFRACWTGGCTGSRISGFRISWRPGISRSNLWQKARGSIAA